MKLSSGVGVTGRCGCYTFFFLFFSPCRSLQLFVGCWTACSPFGSKIVITETSRATRRKCTVHPDCSSSAPGSRPRCSRALEEVPAVDVVEQQEPLQQCLVKALAIRVIKVSEKKQESFTICLPIKIQECQEGSSHLSAGLLDQYRAMAPLKGVALGVNMEVRDMWASFRHSTQPLGVYPTINRIILVLFLQGAPSISSRLLASSKCSSWDSRSISLISLYPRLPASLLLAPHTCSPCSVRPPCLPLLLDTSYEWVSRRSSQAG